jgi:uncharacterized protein (DUF433 family)
MIDWSQCPDVERSADTLGGAWRVPGTRIPVQAILDNAKDCTPEEIAGPDIYPDLSVDTVRRVLRFAYQSELDAIRQAGEKKWPLPPTYQFRADVLTRKLADIEKALRRSRKRARR